jgi:NAD(P)-dependent dehydrogenase (short-subunit alcohol dehydrogenase family)
MDFLNKTVIITGAGNGIEKGIALHYAEKGANVVVADLDTTAGTQTVAVIKENGGQAIFAQTDVRLEKDIVRLMQAAYQTYGRIDILINNAGKSVSNSPYELSVEEWDDIINTNLRSVFLGSREAAKYMRHNKEGGSIVNIASTRAIMSEPSSEAYAATKGGIVSLTHALADLSVSDTVTVNTIDLRLFPS